MMPHESLQDSLDCVSCLSERDPSPRCTECEEIIVVSTQVGDELCLDCLYKDDGHEVGQPRRGGPHEIDSDGPVDDSETWGWSS